MMLINLNTPLSRGSSGKRVNADETDLRYGSVSVYVFLKVYEFKCAYVCPQICPDMSDMSGCF